MWVDSCDCVDSVNFLLWFKYQPSIKNPMIRVWLQIFNRTESLKMKCHFTLVFEYLDTYSIVYFQLMRTICSIYEAHKCICATCNGDGWTQELKMDRCQMIIAVITFFLVKQWLQYNLNIDKKNYLCTFLRKKDSVCID